MSQRCLERKVGKKEKRSVVSTFPERFPRRKNEAVKGKSGAQTCNSSNEQRVKV